MTTRTVRARFHNGVLEPLDEVDLVEDQEVLLTVQPQDEHGDPIAWSIPATLPDMYEDPDGFIKATYQARLDGTRIRPPRSL